MSRIRNGHTEFLQGLEFNFAGDSIYVWTTDGDHRLIDTINCLDDDYLPEVTTVESFQVKIMWWLFDYNAI